MSTGYIVRFVRKDKGPDEEYHYGDFQDAMYHFCSSKYDGYDVYDRIFLLECTGEEPTVLGEINFWT